jgi:hypothetical protein
MPAKLPIVTLLAPKLPLRVELPAVLNETHVPATGENTFGEKSKEAALNKLTLLKSANDPRACRHEI